MCNSWMKDLFIIYGKWGPAWGLATIKSDSAPSFECGCNFQEGKTETFKNHMRYKVLPDCKNVFSSFPQWCWKWLPCWSVSLGRPGSWWKSRNSSSLISPSSVTTTEKTGGKQGGYSQNFEIYIYFFYQNSSEYKCRSVLIKSQYIFA